MDDQSPDRMTPAFLDGGGEIGTYLRAQDWTASPLGPPADWPAPLRTAIRLMLNAGNPMYICWGPELRCFYNDAYRPSIGAEMHPASLGQPAREVWGEIWSIIGPQLGQVMSGDGSIWVQNTEVPFTRNGELVETWWTYSYLPIDDASAPHGVGGVLTVCSEVTDGIRAQRDLRESRERLQLALSGGRGIGTWDWDVPGDRVVADATFASLYGVDPALAATGAPLAAFFGNVHPEDLPRLRTSIEQTLRAGAPFSEEYRLLRPDGSIVWTLSEGLCRMDRDGRPLRFPGISLDISDRKVAEEKLRDLNVELEAKVVARALERGRNWQLSPELLGVVGGDGVFETSNPAWLTTLGWTEEEVAARPFMDLVHPDDRASTVRAWEDAVERAIPALQFENRYRTKTGDWRWLSWIAVPDDGKLYCSARDVTIQREQAEALAASTADRERLWRLSQDLLVVVRADTVIDAVNVAWTQALGWAAEDLVGRPFTDITHPDDLDETRDVFQGVLSAPLTDAYVFRLRRADGSWRSFAWTAAFENGQVYANGRDVTEQLTQAEALSQVEDALRQAQKMEAVGQLTGGIAHDFNNLLAGISGSLEMIEARVAQGRVEHVGRYVAAARDAARRAAALTHRLLAFSRRQTLAPKVIDPAALIAGMDALIRSTVGPGVTVDTALAADLWPVMADASQLENALLNLAINARDAMPDGGALTIETTNRTLNASTAATFDIPAGDYVALVVHDAGTGMDAATIARAVEPFFTTKPIGQGTGLGLSMIYGFSRQSGGGMHIGSVPGQGTAVTLLLPRHATAADVPGIALPVAGTRTVRPAKVLVIDDEVLVQMFIVDILTDMGCTVLEAGTGPAGLALLEATPDLDLLITDVGLPDGMNGRQVADAARALRPDLPVLFVTGYAEQSVLNPGDLEAGMSVLGKPFGGEELEARVADMLNR